MIDALKKTHLQRQNSASNPKHSVWVSANAGAGKTHILVERIIRLLLPPYNCAPHKILCITYTKAAATEMTQRLFDRLGAWIAKDDQELYDEMFEMMGQAPTDHELITARRLFARALESPGGLKIQTIHGFCEHILRRFPIESGFPKDFTLLNDADLRKLYLDALEYVASYSMSHPETQLAQAFEKISHIYHFNSLVDLLIDSRKIYQMMCHEKKPFWDADRLRDYLDLPAFAQGHSLYDQFFDQIDDVKITQVIDVLNEGGKTDQKRAADLAHIQATDYSQFSLWQSFFMNSTQDALLSRSRFVSKNTQTNYPEISAYLLALYDTFEEVLTHHNGLQIFELTQNISFILLAAYSYIDAHKIQKSVCDFDDIILKCRDLLRDAHISPWVLWKLDGGIDHILVDEAQDTSSEQWDIIRALSQEFFVGHGAQGTHRTIFAVGDEKQSIYGFQGAEPDKMSENAHYFKHATQLGQSPWQSENLRGSFRSSPAIMTLVDHVFQGETAEGVLFGDQEKIEHYAVANSGPGYFELMPPIFTTTEDMDDVWHEPLDKPSQNSADAVNAQKIAQKIQEILQSPDILPSTGRPTEPQDIMILLQRRGDTMRHLMRYLKQMRIPVSGLDRINLLEEVAILDLLAIMDFVLYPDDDLTLAQILRSPLCEISEDDLFELAHGRQGKLWSCLCARQGEKEQYQAAYSFLNALLKRSDYVSPFEFLNFILENQRGRKKFIARLGTDCIDGLDEILNKSIDFVMDHSPSLQQFTHYIRKTGGSEKREMDANSNKVQIMTIHGAKGLEAPIVFLPNCCDTPKMNKDLYKKFVITPDFIPMILKEGAQHPSAIAQKEFLKQKDIAENRRLLYVALTRAKDRLYMGGKLKKITQSETSEAVKIPKIPENSWYDYLLRAMKHIPDIHIEQSEDAAFARYFYTDHDTRTPTKIAMHAQPEILLSTQIETLPQWAYQLPYNHAQIETDFINPSNVYADQLSENYNDMARQRGIIIHKMLELLVNIRPDQRRASADKFLTHHYNLTAQTRQAYHKEVFNLIDHPKYHVILGVEGLSEVPIIGQLAHLGGLKISGVIDRMVVTQNDIYIADYKTDRALRSIDQLSSKYILQMALYREALKQIYPDKNIQAMIIATAQPEMLILPPELLDQKITNYIKRRQTQAA